MYRHNLVVQNQMYFGMSVSTLLCPTHSCDLIVNENDMIYVYDKFHMKFSGCQVVWLWAQASGFSFPIKP